MSEKEPKFVDAHVHFQLEHYDDYVGEFDELGLCGAFDIVHDPSHHADATEEDFLALLDRTVSEPESRVHMFYWPNWKEMDDDSFPERCAANIEELHKRGLVGLKVWKDMGLGIRDASGSLVMLDDERMNPIWEKLVELKMILIAHVADPATFWLPLNESNPAYEMLKQRPQWHFGKPGLPSREVLFEARNRLHKRYPELIIINCHCGGYAESVEQLSAWMDEMPNFYASIGRSHIKQEGQPIADLVAKHGDRIMFETDLGMRRGRKADKPWNREAYAMAHARMQELLGGCGPEAYEKFAHLNAERLIIEAKG